MIPVPQSTSLDQFFRTPLYQFLPKSQFWVEKDQLLCLISILQNTTISDKFDGATNMQGQQNGMQVRIKVAVMPKH